MLVFPTGGNSAFVRILMPQNPSSSYFHSRPFAATTTKTAHVITFSGAAQRSLAISPAQHSWDGRRRDSLSCAKLIPTDLSEQLLNEGPVQSMLLALLFKTFYSHLLESWTAEKSLCKYRERELVKNCKLMNFFIQYKPVSYHLQKLTPRISFHLQDLDETKMIIIFINVKSCVQKIMKRNIYLESYFFVSVSD